MTTDLQTKLQHVADKLRQMWGKNPDSDAIEAGITHINWLEQEIGKGLQAYAELEAMKQTTTPKPKTKQRAV